MISKNKPKPETQEGSFQPPAAPMVVTADGSPMVGAPIVVTSRGSPTTVVEPMVVFAGGSQGWEAHQTPSFPSPSQVPVIKCFWLWMVGEKR